jgi:hypothetical protein
MFFLNLALGQLLLVAGAATAFTVALYLLDRARRRQVVSTLRFWTPANQPVQSSRRRMIRQPLSLLLQLAGILLLLLAIAQPKIGNPFAHPGYHVLVLDTSAWMAARNGNLPLINTARRRALQWLASVPASDRVMLVRADAVATPATAFERDFARVRAAILASEPGGTALDLAEALRFARRAQALENASGEVVYVGSGRIRNSPDATPADTRRLRFISVREQIENTGIRSASLARSPNDPGAWDLRITVKNYGVASHTVNLTVGFNRAPIGARPLVLAPGAEQELSFTIHSRQSGLVEARLTPGDAFPDDDHTEILLPALPRLPVVVSAAHPDAIRPLLAASDLVEAEFRKPTPDSDAIWIDPTPAESPIRILKTVHNPHGLHWTADSQLGEGLRANDDKIGAASILETKPGDIAVASVDDGPIIVARPGKHKTVVFGFDPAAPGTRNQLATPLVFADILRWINPETFRQNRINVQSPGSVAATLDADLPPNADLQIQRADGTPIPFRIDQHTVHFFNGGRDSVRVITPGREQNFALTLPEMWDTRWEPPAGVLRGFPRGFRSINGQNEIWPWLALAGALCLIAEWVFYARVRRTRLEAVPAAPQLRRVS